MARPSDSLAQLGQNMFRNIRLGSHAFCWNEVRKGEPVEIKYEEYIYGVDSKGEPEYIDVVDMRGNKYKMRNPEFDWRSASGNYKTVTTTVIPKVKYWSLIG